MTELTPQDMASKLLADRFSRRAETVEALSDPIADTSMVVTLDELRPYHLNPRVTRNPLFEEIKASIRQRGLDAPPAITRRPGELHYTIRNGGNTRLAILGELWGETREERFFRITCLFRPWPQRGEIVALTGHLAENELHGGLTFIERALGVEKARELYEQESDGRALSQAELARRLAADGYPVPQPHISRMQDAVQYLLPAVPNLLYGGLGRPHVEKLAALRKAGLRMCDQHAGNRLSEGDFQALFQEVLGGFDGDPATFSMQRVQDELVGQMAERLALDYDTLLLEIEETAHRQHALSSTAPQRRETRHPITRPASHPPIDNAAVQPGAAAAPSNRQSQTAAPHEHVADSTAQRLHAPPAAALTPTGSKAPAPDRLASIQRMITEKTGEPLDCHDAARAMPIPANALYPMADIWEIEPALDAPAPLRTLLAQLAREIAAEADLKTHIETVEDGMGFVCKCDALVSHKDATSLPGATLTLLRDLSVSADRQREHTTSGDHPPLVSLLLGRASKSSFPRLSDASLVKLFRLIRLARRLIDLEFPCTVPTSD